MISGFARQICKTMIVLEHGVNVKDNMSLAYVCKISAKL